MPLDGVPSGDVSGAVDERVGAPDDADTAGCETQHVHVEHAASLRTATVCR